MGSKAAALAELEQALATKPELDGQVLSKATQHLSALRDAMAERQREHGVDADSRRKLEHVNAVISIVLAAHFPLGAVPWDDLEEARGWLAKIEEA